MVFHSGDDIRADLGRKLVKALDRSEYFGYSLKLAGPEEFMSEASPAAIGTLAYIRSRRGGCLTRRSEGEIPTAAGNGTGGAGGTCDERPARGLSHSSGQVFDIDYSALPPVELECLRFVFSDLGWAGYLGFVEDGIGQPAHRLLAGVAGVFHECVRGWARRGR